MPWQASTTWVLRRSTNQTIISSALATQEPCDPNRNGSVQVSCKLQIWTQGKAHGCRTDSLTSLRLDARR